MSKMVSHDPFGHFKHKLWPKEKPGVKLAIWLFKSRESPWLLCVQVACNIPLESSQWGLQLCFKFHLNRRSTCKVMDPQSCKRLSYGNFWILDSQLGVLGENDIWVLILWPCTKYTIRGKVVASPKSRLWWVLWVWICPWLVLAPKVFQLCIHQLVVWFCASLCEWLIVVILLSPILEF
jgi:hypothetical protein